MFDWLLHTWLGSLFCNSKQIQVKQLASMNEDEYDDHEAEEEHLTSMSVVSIPPPALSDILLKAGKDAVLNERHEYEKLIFDLRNGKDLPKYFQNIWKYLIAESRSNKYDFCLVSRYNVDCPQEYFNCVIDLFDQSCKDAAINIKITRKDDYFKFESLKSIDDAIDDAINKIRASVDNVPRLETGHPYR